MKQALGYPRVDQTPDLQVDELTAAGCHRIFVERAGAVCRPLSQKRAFVRRPAPPAPRAKKEAS